MKVKRKYPIFIKQSDEDYLVYIPFWEIYTEGTSFDDAVRMAEDAIRTMAEDKVANGKPIPKTPDPKEARLRAKEDADDIFDYSDGIMMFVDLVMWWVSRAYARKILTQDPEKADDPGASN